MDTFSDYIGNFPENTQKVLFELRKLIQTTVPNVIESISYKMPAYKLNGKPLVYFAAYKNHIGFYALPFAHEQFKTALAKYRQGKGSVQFPLQEPIPYELIRQMIQFRIKEIINNETDK